MCRHKTVTCNTAQFKYGFNYYITHIDSRNQYLWNGSYKIKLFIVKWEHKKKKLWNLKRWNCNFYKFINYYRCIFYEHHLSHNSFLIWRIINLSVYCIISRYYLTVFRPITLILYNHSIYDITIICVTVPAYLS